MLGCYPKMWQISLLQSCAILCYKAYCAPQFRYFSLHRHDVWEILVEIRTVLDFLSHPCHLRSRGIFLLFAFLFTKYFSIKSLIHPFLFFGILKILFSMTKLMHKNIYTFQVFNLAGKIADRNAKLCSCTN